MSEFTTIRELQQSINQDVMDLKKEIAQDVTEIKDQIRETLGIIKKVPEDWKDANGDGIKDLNLITPAADIIKEIGLAVLGLSKDAKKMDS